MLIIEGADLVGKTTYCKKLVDLINTYEELGGGYVYQHLSRPPRHFSIYHGHVALMGRRIVQDRFHMGMNAYAYARQEEEPLDDLTQGFLEAKLALLGCVSVVITADDELISSRYRARGDDMYARDVVLRANEWFINNAGRFDFHISCKTGKVMSASRTRAIVSEWPTLQCVDVMGEYLRRQCRLTLLQSNGLQRDYEGL